MVRDIDLGRCLSLFGALGGSGGPRHRSWGAYHPHRQWFRSKISRHSKFWKQWLRVDSIVGSSSEKTTFWNSKIVSGSLAPQQTNIDLRSCWGPFQGLWKLWYSRSVESSQIGFWSKIQRPRHGQMEGCIGRLMGLCKHDVKNAMQTNTRPGYIQRLRGRALRYSFLRWNQNVNNTKNEKHCESIWRSWQTRLSALLLRGVKQCRPEHAVFPSTLSVVV